MARQIVEDVTVLEVECDAVDENALDVQPVGQGVRSRRACRADKG